MIFPQQQRIARRALPIILLVILAACLPYHAVAEEPVWRIEACTGSAFSFGTTLTIDQTEAPDLKIPADYETKPFTSAPYSTWRVSRWNHSRGWEVELLHHKIYLQNNPPGVATFRIANGYNMLFVNHARETGPFVFRAGAGAVIAFPVANINDVITDGGYQLAGFAFQGAIGKRFYLHDRFFLSLEGKFTAAHAKVDLKDGAHATAPNVALHGTAGIGFCL